MAKDSPPLPEEFLVPLLIVVAPWLAGTHAVTRVMAQLLTYHLLERIFAEGHHLSHAWDKAALR